MLITATDENSSMSIVIELVLRNSEISGIDPNGYRSSFPPIPSIE
jgi:hypothetical protein